MQNLKDNNKLLEKRTCNQLSFKKGINKDEEEKKRNVQNYC